MGKIKKILENELVGGTQTTDVYPVTSVKAVYDENNERLDHILNRRGVVNVSTNYNDDHIAEVLTLAQAIAKVPSGDKVLGFTMTFLSSEGWNTYRFEGDSITEWNDTDKWDLFIDSGNLSNEKGYNTNIAMNQRAVTELIENSKFYPTIEDSYSENDLEFSDFAGNSIMTIVDGHLRTKGFSSKATTKFGTLGILPSSANIVISNERVLGGDSNHIVIDVSISNNFTADLANGACLDGGIKGTYTVPKSFSVIALASKDLSANKAEVITYGYGEGNFGEWKISDVLKKYEGYVISVVLAIRNGKVILNNLISSEELRNNQEELRNNQEELALSESYSDKDLELSDQAGNNILEVNEGHIKTKKFNSENAPTTGFAEADLDFADENGNVVLRVENGHIKTKKFNSENIESGGAQNILKLPSKPFPLYTVCNDLDKSNKWGINSRNNGISVYLDHFFITDSELNVKFRKNKSTFLNLSQSIIGTGSSPNWNNNVAKYESDINEPVSDGSVMNIKLRTVLNSATSDIKPIVLQIGDSVTEGWFADYPTKSGIPTQSYSWAKYYFAKDAQQKGSGYDALFVGARDEVEFDYNGVTGKVFAEGRSGWDAPHFLGSDSPFYNPESKKFSLQYYLSQYKTLADDGETRLVVGNTAGTKVTNVNSWDLCTPNIVVIQLGMNGNFDGWKNSVPSMIQSIKDEYPNMIVIVSLLCACACNYPSMYPNWDNIYFEDYANAKQTLTSSFVWAIDNLQNEENGIYVIYTGSTMPMPYCCNSREIVNEMSEFQPNLKRYVGVDAIERVKHPSRFGHQAVGYELYSAIKWVMLNN